MWNNELLELPAKLLDYFLRSNKSNINHVRIHVYEYTERMFASNLRYRDRKPKYIIEMPPRPVPAGPLISWPKNASCSRIPARASRASLPLRRWATTCCRLSLRPCTAPLSCSLQPLLKLSFLRLGPSLLQFFLIVSLLLTHGNPIFGPVWILWPFPLAFAFLTEINFSFKFLFAIWSLFPQRFHCYFYLSVVSWQYQKYSTILKHVLCLLCLPPLVCSSYSSFAPSSPFFSSRWQKDCESFTHTLFFQCSPSTISCQPQTTHVFADGRIGILCHALRIFVAHVLSESYPFSLLGFRNVVPTVVTLFNKCHWHPLCWP